MEGFEKNVEMKEKDNIALIIQARTGSSRLPNKMILPFYNGLSIFEILATKLRKAFGDMPILLATSSDESNDILEKIALQNNIPVFRGDENNVLKRFIDAAENFNVSRIIRVCADNPFLDMKEMQKLLSFVENSPFYDYVSFKIGNTPSIKTHFGFWGEYVLLEALKKVSRQTTDSFYCEHVTNYIYEHLDIFNVCFLQPNSKIDGQNNVRMTMDTQQDFELLSDIYKQLQNQFKNNWGIDETISFLDNNAGYKEKMAQQIKKNTK